jgi:hypothetical protein
MCGRMLALRDIGSGDHCGSARQGDRVPLGPERLPRWYICRGHLQHRRDSREGGLVRRRILIDQTTQAYTWYRVEIELHGQTMAFDAPRSNVWLLRPGTDPGRRSFYAGPVERHGRPTRKTQL